MWYLGTRVIAGLGSAGGTVGLNDLRDLFNLNSMALCVLPFPFPACPEQEAPEEVQVSSLGRASSFWADSSG